ncbi:MAG TPA: hypothetical protein VFZ89_09465, partial [Solirubrobacteraceae bacterium]
PYAMLAAFVVGGVLAGFALAGLVKQDRSRGLSPLPATTVVAQLPGQDAAAPVAEAPAPVTQQRALARFARNDRAHVRADWVAGFYPLYETAAKAYGVNWLLIASVHKQESAFSTSRGIYRGLNFARCCAGPMQFNVTNGETSTWDRYRHAYKAAPRPASYNHRTAKHPSVYDDFDAIMAAAKLLRDSGATTRLDARAWSAAYDYYGHDLTGTQYADQVLARALGWGIKGFCINCEADGGILARVSGAWGAPVRAALQPPPPPQEKQRPTALAARHRGD